MSNMDGVKVIKTIRASDPNMPVIAMSGVQMGTSQRTALDFPPLVPQIAGIVRLKKPFRPSHLIHAIREATVWAQMDCRRSNAIGAFATPRWAIAAKTPDCGQIRLHVSQFPVRRSLSVE
jgi:DNA-binding NtrC family response regulator